MRSTSILVLMALVVAFTAAGCRGKKDIPLVVEPPLGGSTTGLSGGGSDDMSSLDTGRLHFQPSGLAPVYFDFDSAALRPDAMKTLEEHAKHIQADAKRVYQIAGHCDERGTQEYNVALGERRALSVRAYLIQLGVSGRQLLTISFGEETPAVTGSNEAAWAKNRRCEFNCDQPR